MQAAGADRLAAPATRRQRTTSEVPEGAGGAPAARPGRERTSEATARPRGRSGAQTEEAEGHPGPGGPPEAE